MESQVTRFSRLASFVTRCTREKRVPAGRDGPSVLAAEWRSRVCGRPGLSVPLALTSVVSSVAALSRVAKDTLAREFCGSVFMFCPSGSGLAGSDQSQILSGFQAANFSSALLK